MAVPSIPGDGFFEYCVESGERKCAMHAAIKTHSVVVAVANGERQGDLGDAYDEIILATMNVIVIMNKGRNTDFLER